MLSSVTIRVIRGRDLFGILELELGTYFSGSVHGRK